MELIKKPDYSFVIPARQFDGMKVFFLTRAMGFMPAEEAEDGYPTRPDFDTINRIASHFPVNNRAMIFMNQVHEDLIIVKTNKKPSFPTADAIITDQKNIALAIKTADCVPIFLYDPKNHIIAAVHAGWRGTALKIAKKALLKMEHFFKTDFNDVAAFIGPAIGACCYEVGKEVYEHMHFIGKSRQDYFGRLKNGNFMMDLKGINAHIIEQEGVPFENIEVSDLCTKCRADLFHSHRRDGIKAGRNISFITILK